MKTLLIAAASVMMLSGCRSSCCRHTTAKPKTKIEFEVSYTHAERSKFQDDSATIKSKWGREF
jgi:hypothetical protein